MFIFSRSLHRSFSLVGLLFLLLALFGLGSFSRSLLGGSLGVLTLVKSESTVLVTDGGDQTFVRQVLQKASGNGTANLELLAEDSSGDAEDLGNLLDHSLVLLLLEENSVIKLFLDLNLGP